jgi:L-arabinose isomerase
MLIMERMGCTASAIVEPFFCDQRRGAVLFGHAGGCDPRLGKQGSTVIEPDLEYSQSEDRHKGSPSLMVTGRPGTVTLAAIQVNARSKGIVVLRGEAISHNRALPGYSEFLVRFANPPEVIIDFMLAKGCSQHFVIGYETLAQKMKAFAEIVGMEFSEA